MRGSRDTKRCCHLLAPRVTATRSDDRLEERQDVSLDRLGGLSRAVCVVPTEPANEDLPPLRRLVEAAIGQLFNEMTASARDCLLHELFCLSSGCLPYIGAGERRVEWSPRTVHQILHLQREVVEHFEHMFWSPTHHREFVSDPPCHYCRQNEVALAEPL